MKYICTEIDTKTGDTVEVHLQGNAANVLLMDPANYEKYHAGETHEYYGGYYTQSPALLRAPRAGRWYVAVDMGGEEGQVDVTVKVRSSKPREGAPAEVKPGPGGKKGGKK